jgi:hypothetical protein
VHSSLSIVALVAWLTTADLVGLDAGLLTDSYKVGIGTAWLAMSAVIFLSDDRL